MKTESWRKSIFKRLIISFILILLPIYVLSIIIYDLGIKTLTKEISNSMISQLTFYQDSLEKEVQTIRARQFDLVNDKDINSLAAIPDSLSNIDKMQGILRIQERLRAIKNSSKYINDVFVMIPAVEKQISVLSVSEFDRQKYDEIQRLEFHSNRLPLNASGVMYLSVQFPYSYMTNKKEKLFIIAVELSGNSFEETLRTMASNEEEGVMLVDIKSRSIIAAKNNSLNEEIYGIIAPMLDHTSKDTEEVVINSKRYIAVYIKSEFFNSVLCKYVPVNFVFHDLEKYSKWFILLIISALVIIVAYSMYLYKFIHKPLSRLAASFKKVERGDFEIHIEHQHDDEFRYIYHRFNAMVENLKTLIDQAYKQKILVQKAEMKQLQSQINPHFLYNSFFILNTMTRVGDYENLERFTEQLGQYFQFVTRNAADEVPIAQEANHARVYTEIQAMRFSNWVDVTFEELPESFLGLTVPRLILQPMIENAFEHGIAVESGQGILLIKFEKTAKEYRIIVEDNGNKLNDVMLDTIQQALKDDWDRREVTALQNIHQRVRLKFGSQSGLTVGRGDMGGMRVTLTIKCEEDDQNVQVIDCG